MTRDASVKRHAVLVKQHDVMMRRQKYDACPMPIAQHCWLVATRYQHESAIKKNSVAPNLCVLNFIEVYKYS